MKEILLQKYADLKKICGLDADPNDQEIGAIIRQALKSFAASCHNPAIWCYGVHTKMLMADFIFELKKVRYIIDNGIGRMEQGGFGIIDETGIAEKGIDGIIISSRKYRDEIAGCIKGKYGNIPCLDIYAELEKAGIPLDVAYYEKDHPYSRYCALNEMQGMERQERDEQARYALLKKIVAGYVEIRDFHSALEYAERMLSLKGDGQGKELCDRLKEMRRLQAEALQSIDEGNVLMLCIDGLRRKEVCEEHLGNLFRFIKKKMYYFGNAYSVSTSTFESLIPAYSENTDLRTGYYEADTIPEGNCRFIREAKRQGRHIFFYTDGFRFMEEGGIHIKMQPQTATEKWWDFLLDAVGGKNGLFYVHVLYESHFSYPNPYTEGKLIAAGTNIMFDYLEGIGGSIRTDYGKQQKDSLRYLDNVIFSWLEHLRCRMVLYSDHGNILIGQGTAMEGLGKTEYTFCEELVRVPLGVQSPETGVGTSEAIISILELNNIIIGLMNRQKISPENKGYVKTLRSEIYNPDFKYLYRKAGYERGLLAFEAFVFQEGYKLAVYADGTTELYLAETDQGIDDMSVKERLFDRIKDEITVCGTEQTDMRRCQAWHDLW